MKILATNTEQLILDTAKKLFFVDGNIHATTQDIADAAGVSRTSIHYYYRSRKLFFDRIFQEAVIELQNKMENIASEAIPLKEKTAKFVDFFIEKSIQQPYLELFIITAYNSYLTGFKFISEEAHENGEQYFAREIAREVAAGNMRPVPPEHFMINLVSLCSFPFLGKSIIENVFDLDSEAYTKLLWERKQVILKLLFFDA